LEARGDGGKRTLVDMIKSLFKAFFGWGKKS
jgi:hypothetical protein